MDLTKRINTRIDDSHASPGASILILLINQNTFYKLLINIILEI